MAYKESVGTEQLEELAVTNAKMAEMATLTIKGNDTGGNAAPQDLSKTEVLTLLNVEDGADVTDATNVDAAGAVMNADASTAAMSFVIDEDTMVSDLDTKVPTQQSVKAYVDSRVASSLVYKGAYDASANSPDLDTSPSGVLVGDTYTVTVAGTFFSTAVEVGDVLIAEVDSASAEADWTIVQNNIGAASETAAGYIELADQSEVNAGTDAVRAVTPDTLEDKTYGTFTGTTITDNVTLKTALQELETAVEVSASETVEGNIELATQAEVNTGTDAVRAVTPDTLEDKTYGTFTGSTITDNVTLKTALQELETAVETSASETVEGNVELATQAEVNAGTDASRVVTADTLEDKTYGTFTGAIISDNVVLKTALQELESAIEGITGVSVVSKVFGDSPYAAADGEVVVYNATGGASTVTLPAAASSANVKITVKKTDASANTVTVDANLSETIDGATTAVVGTQYTSLTFVCDGSAWHII
jgi:hypothetical protein